MLNRQTMILLTVLTGFFGGIARAQAATLANVDYVDADGASRTCASATVVVDASTDTWSTGWYVVTGTVSVTDGVLCQGKVNLILADGAQLTVKAPDEKAGVQVVGGSSSLAIYGQAAGTGTLRATGGYLGAGIGGGNFYDGSNITINGGTVIATGGKMAAGIGGGYMKDGSNITINGGTVIANGVEEGAGIGGGNGGSGSNITINGGMVIANGGTKAAGIGGGNDGGVGTYITINGGTVMATGGTWAAGIGGGNDGGVGTYIMIGGGSVTATGGDGGDAIGSGAYSAASSNIYVANGVEIKAGADAASATVVAHASATTDIAPSLVGQNYVSAVECAYLLTADEALTVQPRYPWNGKVDIVMTFTGASNVVAEVACTFVATNVASQTPLPVTHVIGAGSVIAGSASGTWTRRFVWDASADLGEVEIDDVALTVHTRLTASGGVQLWENGPYWAECNVGATKPEDYGYYFWWGDTVGYVFKGSGTGWVSVADGTSFAFLRGNCPTYGKDNTSLQSLGYIDSTGNLVAAHDAATAHLGAPWRMPTNAELDALVANCTTTWITTNGVYGRLVTGKGDYASKSIFLPSAGVVNGSSLYDTGSCGNYWSSTPNSDYSGYAWCLGFDCDDFGRYDNIRCYGQSVRPLQESAQGTASCGSATAHVALDTHTGARANVGTTERIRFSPAWETAADGAVATVRVNGVAVTNATAGGVFAWTPTQDGTYTFTHAVSTNGVAVGETLNATFVVTGINPDAPTFSPASGTIFDSPLTVSMSCASEGATIHYTTNGTAPTATSSAYKKKFKIAGKTTVSAVAFYPNGNASAVAMAEYALGHCADPTIASVDLAPFLRTGHVVTISRNGDEGVLRYTLDGTEPTAASPVYTGPLTVDDSTVVKAKAFSDRYFDSAVVTHSLVKVWGIGDTMGVPGHTFRTDGDAAFYRDDDATAPEGEAMRSGAIDDSPAYGVYARSVLSTTVWGPGTVSFRWRSSCEQDDGYEWDHAEFAVDGETVAWINGVTDWESVTNSISGAGLHTLAWTYLKDDAESAGEDCVRVADFVWTSAEPYTHESAVPVPYAWIRAYLPQTADEYAAYEAVVGVTAANGHDTVEETYVAGLDPTNATSELTALITLSNNIPCVAWTPNLNATSAQRLYRIYGRAALESGDWETPAHDGHRFFKVQVAMRDGATESDVPGPLPEKPLGGVQLWENGPYWAECNVGSAKPEDYGYYFWWGDTVGYMREGGTWTSDYYYSGVTWVSSAGTAMDSSPFSSSVCPTYDQDVSSLQSLGYIDSTCNLVAAHDAATAHLGAPWRMPTNAELDALVANCTTTWITTNGVYGRLVTGKGDYASKSIFLPAAGNGDGARLYSPGSYGSYWSSTADTDDSGNAGNLKFDLIDFSRNSYGRNYGRSVRPLRVLAQ